MGSSSNRFGRRTFLVAGLTSTVGCVGSVKTPWKDTKEEATTAAFEVETIATGLNHPWGIAFVPDETRALVTERSGRLMLVGPETDTVEHVEGTPEVYAENTGGLLDVETRLDEDTLWVYLTYVGVDENDLRATHLGRGALNTDELRLEGVEVLHAVRPFIDVGENYGSRVTFGADGAIYMTSGDRGYKNFGPDHVAQDTTNEFGATLRLKPDGAIPEDNPFVHQEGRDAIFSYGHRNPQGLTVHPETGNLWQSDHGEEDGDSIAILEAGGNYGWPVANYGCEYGTDDSIGDRPDERDDVVDPVYYWECNGEGFPPAGMTFYDGDAFPEWQGDLFVGNLNGEYLGRFTVNVEDQGETGVGVEEVEPLLSDRGWRIRDVQDEPETGYLYVVVDADDAPLLRLVPE